MSNGIYIKNITNSFEYEFDLVRHSGKKSSLKKGNEMINANDPMHYMVKSMIAEHLRSLSYNKLMAMDNDFSKDNPYFTINNPCNILITVYTPTKRRTDAPNFYPTIKPLIDGMTDAGLWSDDNDNIIKTMGFTSGGVNKVKAGKQKTYRIKITVSPIREMSDQ